MTHEEIAVLLEKTEEHLERSEYALAEKLANEVLSSGPERKDDEASALCILGECCLYTARYDEALTHFGNALAAGEATSNLSLQARALNGMAIVQDAHGDYTTALRTTEHSLALAEKADDKKRQAEVQIIIGNVYDDLAKYGSALDYFNRGLRLAQHIGDRRIEVMALNNLGNLYYGLGDYTQALEYSTRALALAEERGDKRALTAIIGNIGNVHWSLSDYSRALDCYVRAHALGEEIGNKSFVAITLHQIGGVYYKNGDYASALAYFKKALALSELIGAHEHVGHLMRSMANVHTKQGNLDAAYQGMLDSLNYQREVLKTNSGVAMTLGALSDVLFTQGKAEEGLARLEEALALADELGEKKTASEAHKDIADAYSKIGDTAQAFEHLTKHLALDKEIFSEESRKSVEKFNMRVAIADMESQKEVQRLKAERSESILRLKERDLANTASSLAAQTELLGNFRADLRKIVLRPDRYEPEDIIRQVKAKLKELPCEMIDFSKFEGQFATVHPEFRAKLEMTYPELTPQEVKMCMLIHVKLQTAAIARLMCLSERTVEKHRENTRKKLDLKKGEDLAEVLRKLDGKG